MLVFVPVVALAVALVWAYSTVQYSSCNSNAGTEQTVLPVLAALLYGTAAPVDRHEARHSIAPLHLERETQPWQLHKIQLDRQLDLPF